MNTLIMLSILLSMLSQRSPSPQGNQESGNVIAQVHTTKEVSEKTTLPNAFGQALYNSGLSGGVVTLTKGCEVAAKDFHVPAGMQLSSALDALAVTDGGHRWSLEKGAVLLLPTEGVPKLLQTRIRSIRIRDRNNLNLAASQLLQANEVRDAAFALALTELSPEIGFQKLTKSPSVIQENPLDFANISLLDALNTLASGHTNAIWSYAEFNCNGRKTARLDFISK